MKYWSKYFRLAMFLAIIAIFASVDLLANYELSINHRRSFDRIEAEIWVKRTDAFNARLGYGQVALSFNTQRLRISQNQTLGITDTIANDLNLADPVVVVNSSFDSRNGYSALRNNSTNNQAVISFSLNSKGSGGIIPRTAGRGHFIGKISFDILNNTPLTSVSNIQFVESNSYFMNVDSLAIDENIIYPAQNSFNIVGLTVLSFRTESETIDMRRRYAALNNNYSNGSFPIYFERSIDPTKIKIATQSPLFVDENLSYVFDYSTNGGTNWIELGRLAETNKVSSVVASNATLFIGNIHNQRSTTSYTITSQNGERLNHLNFRKPVRVVWGQNSAPAIRSENAVIRVAMLDSTTRQLIANRAKMNVSAQTQAPISLGSLMFAQLDGGSQHFKTEESLPNATQLTVMAWINLNRVNANSNPAIVASSGGPDASPIFGSSEGAWMLYLKDGNLPSFRVRELLGRGQNGYLADISLHQFFDRLNPVSDAKPFDTLHKDNWVHLAATVADNVVSLYLNGELVIDFTNTLATDMRMLTTNHPIWIGRNPNANALGNPYVNMGVKGVQVWKTALSNNQIRQFASGVSQPANVTGFNDVKGGLFLYYTLDGDFEDKATNAVQSNNNRLQYFLNGNISDMPNFRPDMAHIKLTSPTGGDGVNPYEFVGFPIRWIGYGLGNFESSGTNDVDIEYSIDSGRTWTLIRDSLNVARARDLESNRLNWFPFNNNQVPTSLRPNNPPYDFNGLLRIRGTETFNQRNIAYVSKPFILSKYMSLYFNGRVFPAQGQNSLNIENNQAMFAAWIKPHRFPTVAEGSFPIFSKSDSTTGKLYYDLRLLPTGQLNFRIADADGKIREAVSDASYPLIMPNSIEKDTTWTHIAVYFNSQDVDNKSKVIFYIDGFQQSEESQIRQLGNSFFVYPVSDYPLYIANSRTGDTETRTVNGRLEYFTKRQNQGFIGEMRDLSFWSGAPNNLSHSGTEPTPLTLFIQGALNVYTKDLQANNRVNLHSSFALNGSPFNFRGRFRAIPSDLNGNSYFNYGFDPGIKFVLCDPFIKLVSPKLSDRISVDETALRVRWVGFHYDATNFTGGAGAPRRAPSLEFSLLGGGGLEVQPYQFVGSQYWNGNTQNAFSIPTSSQFRFNGTGSELVFAGRLNITIADPDMNNDGRYDDQGPLAATLTNARFRLNATNTTQTFVRNIRSESQLFTLVPRSNFTVRVLLEGYHNGMGTLTRQIGNRFDNGGLYIGLFTNTTGSNPQLIASSESQNRYQSRSTQNRATGENNFANVNLTFAEIPDGAYMTLIHHRNHLPVLSRFPAPFRFLGNTPNEWRISSGWDFQTWNGVDNNILQAAELNPWTNRLFTAFGIAISSQNNVANLETSLIFNTGYAKFDVEPMSAMVGGDINGDFVIDSLDLRLVEYAEGSTDYWADVTGNDIVNANDRAIVLRNRNRKSAIPKAYLDQLPVRKIDVDSSIFEGIRYNFDVKNVSQSDKIFHIFSNGIEYKISVSHTKINDLIYYALHIINTGTPFNMGNATFALNYDISVLEYIDIFGQDSAYFADKPEFGYYNQLRSTPDDRNPNKVNGLRTIEIDFDPLSGNGLTVPIGRTFIGGLVFKLLDENSFVSLSWNSATAIQTSEGEIIDNLESFEDIPPLIFFGAELITPAGGETFLPGASTTIQWSSFGSPNLLIEFSTNSGNTWNRITEINADSAKFEWSIPDVNSSNCRVRLVEKRSLIELSRSNLFSIIQGDATVISPRAGDPMYRGGENTLVQFNVSGYNNFAIQFSANGNDNWITLATGVNSNVTSQVVTMPVVTSRNAVIRLFLPEGQRELARSASFKILGGSLTFRTPQTGDLIYNKTQNRIRWNSINLSTFDLQISYDGGSTWENLALNITSLDGFFNWNTPDIESDLTMIRALWNSDPEFIYGGTGIFYIRSFNSVEDENLQNDVRIYPNPTIGNSVRIEINDFAFEDIISLSLTNSIGETIFYNIAYQFYSNQIVANLDLSNLSAGIYYLNIATNSGKQSKIISVIR